MVRKIKKAAIFGAGTMGSGIAALLSGVGIKTYLLDIVPKELTEDEKAKGLTLEDPRVRNRITASGLQRTMGARPAAFFDTADANLITVGNVEDNLDWLSEVDWIIEAVFERLDVKKSTFALIEKSRGPETIISSNTSGISLATMIEDVSDEMKKHTLITHFFNPVRYMKLLEVVPGEKTDPEIVKFISDYSERVLGKGVVFCKDTPNFIANRIGVFSMLDLIRIMMEEGYKIEEIDKIFGPPMGRPKSAIFRTADMVGIDVLADVAKNMYDSLTQDKMRDVYQIPDFMKKMIETGLLGLKTKQGFYKKTVVEGKKAFHVFDYNTMDYRSQEKVAYDSLNQAAWIAEPGERIKTIVHADDRAGNIAWKALSGMLLYAAERIPEISDNIYSIDNAMKWGFNWDLGPFEAWDAIGVKESVERMEKEGKAIPEIVQNLLSKGENSFYKKVDTKKVYFDFASKDFSQLPESEGIILLSDLKEADKIIKKSQSATLLDLDDGVALLEFHSVMNTIDEDMVEMILYALDEVEKNYLGLVIGNEGENFSAGANVSILLEAMQNKQWDVIDAVVKKFQDVNMAIKYYEKPVVAAPFNRALGGGAEIVLASSRVRAHCELYMGLVEFGMGLIPGGGGNKEVWIRLTENIASDVSMDLYPLLQKAFENIGLAKVSMSAKETYGLGYLREDDKITMNRERLIADAKETVLAMVKEGFVPKKRKKVKVLGREGYAAMAVGVMNLKWGNQITDHEEVMAKHLAKVLTGGDVHEGTEVDEQYLLDLEREKFIVLCGTEKTQQRIQTFLSTGKMIRN